MQRGGVAAGGEGFGVGGRQLGDGERGPEREKKRVELARMGRASVG